jgi:hypothetical protein
MDEGMDEGTGGRGRVAVAAEAARGEIEGFRKELGESMEEISSVSQLTSSRLTKLESSVESVSSRLDTMETSLREISERLAVIPAAALPLGGEPGSAPAARPAGPEEKGDDDEGGGGTEGPR